MALIKNVSGKLIKIAGNLVKTANDAPIVTQEGSTLYITAKNIERVPNETGGTTLIIS